MRFELKVEFGVKSILSLDFVFLICLTSSKKAIILNNIAWVWAEMHVIAKRKHWYMLVSCMSVLALLCPKSKRMTFHCLFNFDQQYITHQEKWSSHSCNSYCWNICKLRYLAMAWNVCKLRYLAMAWNVCKLRYLVMTGSGWKVISSGGVIVTCPNQIEHWAVLLWDKCCLWDHLL